MLTIIAIVISGPASIIFHDDGVDFIPARTATTSLQQSEPSSSTEEPLETTSFYRYPDGTIKEATPEAKEGRAGDDKWHPLSKMNTTWTKREEVVFFGDQGGQMFGMAVDGPQGLTDPLHDWNQTYNATDPAVATGDFDADGYDETIVVGERTGPQDGIVAYIWDDALHNFALMKVWDDGDLTTIQPAVASGDFDLDGVDEIVICAVNEGLWSTRSIWVLDDAFYDFRVVQSWQEEGYDEYGSNPYLAAGDLDGDHLDEFVVTSTEGKVVVSVYDDAYHDYGRLSRWWDTPRYYGGIGQDQPEYINSTLSLGDVDGDGDDEIVLSALVMSDFPHFETWVLDFERNYISEKVSWTEGYYAYAGAPTVTMGDIDGDSRAEVILAYRNRDTGPTAGVVAYVYEQNGYYFSQYATKYMWNPYDGNPYNYERPMVSTGDIDCDGIDETIFFGRGVNDKRVKGWAMDYDAKAGTFSKITTWDLNTTSRVNRIALGDIDGDGMVIGFTGQVTRTLTPPRALVVMASPPVVENIAQNKDESGTAYGTEVFKGETRSHEVGSTASTTISYEAGDPFGIVSASMSATMSSEFSITETHESLETYGTSHESAYPDDVVIYEATLYENYIYEILAHPDPTLEGTKMSIDVPVTPDGPSIFKTTVDFFNHIPGASPIDRKTFTHRPGAVWSYPTVQEKNDILMTYPGWESNLEYVGQGSATSTVSIALEESQLTEESRSMSFELEAGVSVGGVGFSASYGVFEKNVFGLSVGESTQYEGTVGDIEKAEDWRTHGYFYGMYVYNYRLSPSIGFQVINYWVQNYNAMPDREFLAYWGFDDDEYEDVAEDKSSWFRDGELTGATRSNDTINGKGLTFEGGTDVMQAETIGFSTKEGTFETWMKLDPMNGSANETIFSAPAELPDEDEGLVGHWRMNEYGWSNRFYEVKDATENKNDGRGRDGANTHYWGRYGRSGLFNGNSAYVSAGKEANLRPTDHVTVECWVNIRTLEDWESIVSYAYDTSDRESGYDLMFHSGQLKFRVSTGSSGFKYSPGFTPQTQVWYHVVGVYDGAAVRLYINGMEQGSGTATSGAIDWTHTSANEFYIGKFHDNNEDGYFRGKIDEVLIYDRPLSSTEVDDHFHFGLSLVRHNDETLSFSIGNSTLTTDISGLTGWHHVATTWNTSGRLEMYLDGQPVANASTFWIGDSFAYHCYLGNDESGERGFHGTLDAIAIWGRNLSAKEINASFESKGAVKEILFDFEGTQDLEPETKTDSDKDHNGLWLLALFLFIAGAILIFYYFGGLEMLKHDISKIPIGDVRHIEETALTVDEYHRRSTVPSKVFHALELQEGDSLRWITLNNGMVLVTKNEEVPSEPSGVIPSNEAPAERKRPKEREKAAEKPVKEPSTEAKAKEEQNSTDEDSQQVETEKDE